MKLKKLLAAVTAAALAVTTMAVTSFTASAADTTVTLFPATSCSLVDLEFNSAANAAIAGAQSKIEISVTGTQDAGSEWCQFYLQQADDPWTGDFANKGTDANGTLTITSGAIWNALGTYSGGYKLNGDNIHATAITVKVDDGSPITAWQPDTSPIVTGNWANSKVVAAGSDLTAAGLTSTNLNNASFKVTYTISGASGQVGLKAGWADVIVGDVSESGTITLALKDATEANAENVPKLLDDGLRVSGADVSISKVELIISTGSQGGDTENPGDNDPVNPPAAGRTHEGSATLAPTEYENWYEAVISKSDLLGDLDPANTTIVFTGADLAKVGYNSISADDYNGVDCTGTFTLDASDLKVDEGYFLHVCGTAATAVTWVATEGGSGEEGDTYTITIDDDFTLDVGETARIGAEITCTSDGVETAVANNIDNAEDFEWGIENTAVATIDANGVLTAVAPGTTRFHVIYRNENIEDGYIDIFGNVTVRETASVTPAPSTSTSTTSPNPAPVSSTTVVDMILATPDGGNGTVTLGSSTKLDKVAMEALATKGDVTVKFNVAGGAYWEINGSNVTDAKAVDLGVKVNSSLIPESKVSEFAGDKTTVQLTLRHNGDFGFTGTLCVPVGKANNGKFANLYYYHGGQFDFVGSSAISGGMTKFAFSHASNYLIVIDDYAYGEDVSSAAGMTETAAETSTVPYVAVLVVISAFGASAIVLKKRLSK